MSFCEMYRLRLVLGTFSGAGYFLQGNSVLLKFDERSMSLAFTKIDALVPCTAHNNLIKLRMEQSLMVAIGRAERCKSEVTPNKEQYVCR